VSVAPQEQQSFEAQENREVNPPPAHIEEGEKEIEVDWCQDEGKSLNARASRFGVRLSSRYTEVPQLSEEEVCRAYFPI
jgi:hypothetical protein